MQINQAFLLLPCAIFSSLIQISDSIWGGGLGGQFGLGGFHSGYGYGSGTCAGARQRQGIGNSFPVQPISPYSYNNDNNNRGYYHNGNFLQPSIQNRQPVVMSIPVQQDGRLDYRINIPSTTPTTPAPVTCSQPNIRDPVVFNQQCILPLESTPNLCTARETFPIGTTSLTSCKLPDYYSETGDMILEVCKNGKWHSNGKTLTCKSNITTAIAPPVPTAPPARDSIGQYYGQRQQQVVVANQPVPNQYVQSPLQDYYSQSKQPYWIQPVTPSSSSSPQEVNQPEGLSKVESPIISSPYYWNNNNNTQVAPYNFNIPPPPISSTTTTTTTKPTTTTTQKPFLIDTIDWRQYSSSSTNGPVQKPVSDWYYQPKEDYVNQSDTNFEPKCPPLLTKTGVILECMSKVKQNQNGGYGYLLSVSDCSRPQNVGTEATYKCQMYFEQLTGPPTQYRKCKENTVWTGNDDEFGCKLECGKSNPAGRLPLITNGEMTILGQWPWHAALFIRDRGDITTNACGATLITKKAVLTAAHCVNLYLSSLTRDLNDIRVDLGRYHREKDDPYVQKFKVDKVITHPAYNPYIFESDIAIIILTEQAKIGFHVRPICFPKSQNAAFDEIQLADGSYATVVGWGLDETGESPDELRAAKIQVIGYRECIQSFEEADTGALLAKSTTFCAGNKNGTNVCSGDSGSGAFFAVKTSTGSTRWYLQGIVSLGINVSANNKKCDPEKVSIFTRVSPYADWINRVLSDNDAL